MSGERIVSSRRLKVIEMPRNRLSGQERQASNLVAARLKTTTDGILGSDLERKIFIGSSMLLIARPQSFKGDLYDGATVVIEKYRMDDAKEIQEREYSYAIYPEVTINRPNRALYYEDVLEDDTTRRREVRMQNDNGGQNYEVKAEELERLNSDLLLI